MVNIPVVGELSRTKKNVLKGSDYRFWEGKMGNKRERLACLATS